ncbi:MAG: Dihydroorotate dehydrogenase B (NAD(+)), electron transfer subunit [Thermoanaerobaculia bacterium]|nr:Dihydroorotate dehydrogenase B (NAD(+)), electron transfer subunit [Thermoanaerobaculia bacterium]
MASDGTCPPLLPGFTTADLHDPFRLQDLDRVFREALAAEDAPLSARFERFRAGEELDESALSAILVDASRPLSRFIATLFGVEEDRAALLATASDESVLFKFRWTVFQKRTLKKFPSSDSLSGLDPATVCNEGTALVRFLTREGDEGCDEELSVARAGLDLHSLTVALATPRAKDTPYSIEAANERLSVLRPRAGAAGLPGSGSDAELLAAWTEIFDRYAALLKHSPQDRAGTEHWPSLWAPKPFKFDRLVETIRPDPSLPEVRQGDPHHFRLRDGFQLTDPRKSPREVTGETHYCLLCHDRGKDSCSKGFVKKEGGFKTNPLGIPLAGCPLDEKISEMHILRREGDSLGALALIAVDNPMLPGTGHRICNDCMKGCIFQTQDPVDIPQVETGVLTDVLKMPWGFEIWSLLTRWNPLNRKRPFPLPYNGKNVLVVGLGPAGYTLAHHLLNEGFGVIAIDGLKIEPLPEELTGSAALPPRPVRDVTELHHRLDQRVLTGFGGVSEYGITVRWDKNFLDLLYLNLARRRTLSIVGGVRFGGTLTLEQAFDLGFDHVAIAAGAGKPTLVGLRNNLLRGVRQASDFLMALQLSGAFKEHALANLHVELPVVVIGGGLTAIDTATESLAYYPILVEKVLARHEALVAEIGREKVEAWMTPGEKATLSRMLEHGRAVREERARAAAAGKTPNFLGMTRAWGGSTIAYRRSMEESPAYRLNHEEIAKGLEEGVVFAENLEPVECLPDEFGSIEAAVFKRRDGSTVTLPCRTLLIAAGTSPNVTYGREHPGSIPLDRKDKFFRPHLVERTESGLVLRQRDDGAGAFFTGYERNGRFVSYFGDNHPVYAGSVVKAMASARDGAPRIRELFLPELDAFLESGFSGQGQRDEKWARFSKEMRELLLPEVVRVDRLTPTIVEVIVKAPQAARNFEPGQFYRFQNYETHASRVTKNGQEIPMLIEPCALTGAWVDKEKGLLSMIALELGTSTKLCSALRPGEPVIVMGPTGTPTELPRNETVVLCGGGLGNAVLFSIGRAARERGNRVLYFAGYKKADDFYKREEIEAGADVIVFAVDGPPAIPARRPQDVSFVGNIVQAMLAYAKGELGEIRIPLPEATRLIAIGSDRMMAAVAAARHGVLSPYMNPCHTAIGSINSPMQCMMKEICAQCLQRHIDPVTGEESYVFSCFNQDQPLDRMDWGHLNERLTQNGVEEKLASQWLDHLLAIEDVRKI